VTSGIAHDIERRAGIDSRAMTSGTGAIGSEDSVVAVVRAPESAVSVAEAGVGFAPELRGRLRRIGDFTAGVLLAGAIWAGVLLALGRTAGGEGEHGQGGDEGSHGPTVPRRAPRGAP